MSTVGAQVAVGLLPEPGSLESWENMDHVEEIESNRRIPTTGSSLRILIIRPVHQQRIEDQSGCIVNGRDGF